MAGNPSQFWEDFSTDLQEVRLQAEYAAVQRMGRVPGPQALEV